MSLLNSSRTSAAARRRSWRLLHVLAAMTLAAMVLNLTLLIDSVIGGVPSKLPLPPAVRFMGALCFVAVFWLWIRMLVDYFRERPARHTVAWGWFLLLGVYIGALACFWIIWRPRHRISDA